jgi:hypothetical protein
MQAVRRHLNRVVHLCLALALFSQFAMAAQACTSLQGTPTAAFKQEAGHHHCHEGRGSVNPNACLMHCLQGDQAPVPVEAVPVAQFSAIAGGIPAAPRTAAWQPDLPQPQILAVDSGPPIPIRYCRFLN